LLDIVEMKIKRLIRTVISSVKLLSQTSSGILCFWRLFGCAYVGTWVPQDDSSWGDIKKGLQIPGGGMGQAPLNCSTHFTKVYQLISIPVTEREQLLPKRCPRLFKRITTALHLSPNTPSLSPCLISQILQK